MRRHSEVLEQRQTTGTVGGWALENWGWSRPVGSNPLFALATEIIAPGARRGAQTVKKGQYAACVTDGILWVREVGEDGANVSQCVAGQCYSAKQGIPFELAASSGHVALVVVRSTGAKIDEKPTPRRAVSRRPVARPSHSGAMPARRPQRRPQLGPEERAAVANMAQGLNRVQPLPGQPRTAAEVHFGFNQYGTNLVPVVPEP